MRRFLMCVLGVVVAAGPAWAGQDGNTPVAVAIEDQAQAKPAPEEKTAAPKAAGAVPTQEAPPPRIGALANVRLEVTIADQRSAGQPTTKTVALVLADRANGRIRTTGEVLVPFKTKQPDGTTNTRYNTQRVVLNVDAYPEFTRDGRVRAHVTLEYRPVTSEAPADHQISELVFMGTEPTTISETFTVILEDGKPLVVSQSADPTTDRRVRVEVKATILK